MYENQSERHEQHRNPHHNRLRGSNVGSSECKYTSKRSDRNLRNSDDWALHGSRIGMTLSLHRLGDGALIAT